MTSNKPRILSNFPKSMAPHTTSDDIQAKSDYLTSHMYGKSAPVSSSPQATSAAMSDKAIPRSQFKDPRNVPPPTLVDRPLNDDDMMIVGATPDASLTHLATVKQQEQSLYTGGNDNGNSNDNNDNNNDNNNSNNGGRAGNYQHNKTRNRTNDRTNDRTRESMILSGDGDGNDTNTFFSSPHFSLYDIVLMMGFVAIMVMVYTMYQIASSVNQTNALLQAMILSSVTPGITPGVALGLATNPAVGVGGGVIAPHVIAVS